MKSVFRAVLLGLFLLLAVVVPVSAQAGEPAEAGEASIFGYLGIILAVAFLTETLVEFVCADIFLQFPQLAKYSWTKKYAAIAVGIGAEG